MGRNSIYTSHTYFTYIQKKKKKKKENPNRKVASSE
jgi:hypothetical protein